METPPVINDPGQVAFKGFLREGSGGVTLSNSSGIWCESMDALQLVMRKGFHAPGTGEGVIFSSSITEPVLNNMGHVCFRAKLEPGFGGVVFDENDGGIWSGPPGDVSIIMRYWEDQAPGFPLGVNFKDVFYPVMNHAGQFAFTGRTQTGVAGVTVFNNRGCWVGTPGNFALIARQGFSAPTGFASETFEEVGLGLWPVVINKWGRVAFLGVLDDVAFSPYQYYDDGIWSNGTTDLWVIARESFNFPGMPANTGFRFLTSNPVICDTGQISFCGKLQVGWGGVTDANDECIFVGVAYTGANESIGIIAREGDPAPGTPGWKFEANNSYAFRDRPMMNSAQQVAFESEVLRYWEGEQIKYFWGIWATNPLGELVLVAKTGDQIEVSPGVFKTISDLGAGHYPPSGGSDGHPRALNDAGLITFRAEFTDGSEGIFIADLNVLGTTAAIAYGENRSGSILGGSGMIGGVEATFAQTGGGILWGEFNEIVLEDFLNSLGDPGSGWPFDYVDFGPASDSVQLWNIEFTGTFAGDAIISFGYRDTSLAIDVNEEDLAMYHFTGDKWVQLVGAVDTLANTITVEADSLSYFALGAVVPDCEVGFEHFASFAQQWFDSGSGLAADLDGDNDVDMTDLTLFVDKWLRPCPFGWPLL